MAKNLTEKQRDLVAALSTYLGKYGSRIISPPHETNLRVEMPLDVASWLPPKLEQTGLKIGFSGSNTKLDPFGGKEVTTEPSSAGPVEKIRRYPGFVDVQI